jgi:hypothetical protein
MAYVMLVDAQMRGFANDYPLPLLPPTKHKDERSWPPGTMDAIYFKHYTNMGVSACAQCCCLYAHQMCAET